MAGRFRWLTPNTAPADTICRVLVLPADFDWLAVVSGALVELTDASNFESYGTATPQDCADVFSVMFDKFSHNEGVCRVIGEIIAWAGSSSPDTKWLLCDGASLVRADYPDLFAVIGTTYGASDGSHFNLPDLRGVVSIGAGTHPGLSTYALGDTGGEETHQLVTAEIPSHSHTDVGHSHADLGHAHAEGSALPAVGAAIVGVPIPSAVPSPSVTGVGNANIQNGSANINNTGGDGAHENRQPFLAINYLIVALQ